jgi:hypothetical protein
MRCPAERGPRESPRISRPPSRDAGWRAGQLKYFFAQRSPIRTKGLIALVHLFHADLLAGKHLTDIDLATLVADAAAGGDDGGPVVAGIFASDAAAVIAGDAHGRGRLD